MVRLLLTTIVAMTASFAISCTREGPLAPKNELSNEEYAVYNAFLIAGSATQVSINVAEDTLLDPVPIDGSLLAIALKRRGLLTTTRSLEGDLLNSFNRVRNLGKQLDATRLNITNVKILSANQLYEALQSNLDPDLKESRGIISVVHLSRVRFNRVGTHALMATAITCGPLCGAMFHVLLAKTSGRWQIEAETSTAVF